MSDNTVAGYPFTAVATVNLKKTFKGWEKLKFHDYMEPATGWTIKLGKAFEDGTIILLFENTSGERAPYYRAYVYGLQEDQYRLTDKLRFPGDSCTICAISLTESHDALFFRQYNKDKREEIFFREIGDECKDYCAMTVSELKEHLLPPSKSRFALIEKKRLFCTDDG